MKYRVAAVPLALVAALALGACAQSERGTESQDTDASFTFAMAGSPKMFDPFYASDGETFRVTDSLFEGLLAIAPGSVEVEPSLATEWKSSEDGTTWTFQLRDDVTFHDGTKFDAAAVCSNFERWYNQAGIGQSAGVSYSWINDFGGFADQEDIPSLYESCQAESTTEVTLQLSRASSHMPAVLAYSSFAISSPAALEEFDADNVQADGDGFTWPEYAMSHPTGTGPFTFDGYDTANGLITVKRFDDYWGDPAGVSKVTFKVIPGEAERRQELESGSIDGYDLPNPVDWADLEAAGNQVLVRDAFNLMFVGLNPLANDALLDLRVRQALLYATNRQQLVETQLPEGAYVASQPLPKLVTGHNPELEPYPYDPERAKELLAEAGHSDLTIELWYPTEVSRPYMPDPARVFEAIRSDWDAVGITVEPVSLPWNGGYIDGVYANRASAFFLGGTNHYDSPDVFFSAYFGSTDTYLQTGLYDFGDQLVTDVKAADAIGDPGERLSAYKKIDTQLMESYMPMLPLAHTPPALVVGPHVKGIIPSPVTKEDFAAVTITR